MAASASIRQMEQELRRLAEHRYCVGLHVLIMKVVLTGQTFQLFRECSNDDVVLNDVRHLVLQVLLIECDQGIRASIPNLNDRPITLAVNKSFLKCFPPFLYI